MNSFGEQDDRWAEFLDRLVHDLREPLRSIYAFSELLVETEKDKLGPEGERSVGEILSGATRIRDMVEGISGFSLALRESGDSQERNGASLQLAFDLVLDSLQDRIRASDATIVGENLPRVKVRLERLMQLLQNLIGNSLKFRGEAPPLVRVSAEPDREGWKIQVEDNGLGIDPMDCEAVFKSFTKIHGKKYPGAGLGLAVCRQIVEAHGGSIRMSPLAPAGSVCTFWLPAA